MIRMLRSLMLVAAAVAFLVSSVGWSMASVRIMGGTAIVTAEKHAHAGHDHGRAHTDPAACKTVTGEANCAGDHSRDGEASSCCALACHMAIPLAFAIGPWAKALPVLGDASLNAGLDDAGLVRLERPPRSSNI